MVYISYTSTDGLRHILSCKSALHIFCPLYSHLSWQIKSGTCFSILARTRTPTSFSLVVFHCGDTLSYILATAGIYLILSSVPGTLLRNVHSLAYLINILKPSQLLPSLKNTVQAFCFLLLLFSCQVASDSLQPHGLQGFLVPHHLPKLAQVHVHWSCDGIHPSHPQKRSTIS